MKPPPLGLFVMKKELITELLAKVRNLPFDRLRVNGLRLKLFSFSVRGELVEPQKNTFARSSRNKEFFRIALAIAEVQTPKCLTISAIEILYSRLQNHEHGSPATATPRCGCRFV